MTDQITEIPDGLHLKCATYGCDSTEFEGYNGCFFCQRCSVKAEGDVVDHANQDDDINFTLDTSRGYAKRHVVAPAVSQSQPLSQLWQTLQTQEDNAVTAGDLGGGHTEPADFGLESGTLCHEDYYSEIRMRYVKGVQIMLQLQIKALVDKFNVSPVILDMVEPIWLKFVASTKVFADDRVEEVMKISKYQVQGKTKGVALTDKHEAEPSPRCMIWYRYISKTIPLSYSLVISFLVCHLAREPILSTDIIQWTIEGKLPYFAAFVEIDEHIGTRTKYCPISSRSMFRPIHAITVQSMESLAASLANSIRLELPPVNFYAIASRYLRQLSLPVETILPHACRIYEWSMPSELWLSANEFRFPTRSFVLSILIVAIRILYNIHGFGKWEMSLSSSDNKSKKLDVFASKDQEAEFECNVDVNSGSLSSNREPCTSSQSSGVSFTEPYNKLSKLDATNILHVLHSKYDKLIKTSDHGKDLEKYLEYCKDMVFADVELSFEEYEEEQLMEDIWDIYQKKQEKHKPFDTLFSSPSCSPHKRPQDSSKIKANKIKKRKTSNDSKGSHKERAIQRMISNMKENKFCYIPPRSRVKRLDYLHYTRKKGDGIYVYAAHTDYYILLRSFARVDQLDVRTMHAAVLTFERRLDWLEKNIGHCFKDAPSYIKLVNSVMMM